MIGMADGTVIIHQVCMGEYVRAFHLAMAIYTGLPDGFPPEKIVINGAMRRMAVGAESLALDDRVMAGQQEFGFLFSVTLKTHILGIPRTYYQVGPDMNIVAGEAGDVR